MYPDQRGHQIDGISDYFDVEVRNGRIILTPVRIQHGDPVRAKLAELDLQEQDIADAVDWARKPPVSKVIHLR